MSWKPHNKFQAGQYRAVVDELLDRKGASAARKRHIVSLIGALSFLGRMEEASDLFDLVAKKSKDPLDLIASRFFLAIGFTRRSEYERSRTLFDLNEKEAGKSAFERFFVHQGKVFFLFYTGRLEPCLMEAENARKWAIAAKDLWARCLATDALGHVQVRAGEIHSGLSHLREAQRLAQKIGNNSTSSAIGISCKLYEWEYGLQTESLADLEAAIRQEGPENNYSQSNLALELARQHTLRGNFSQSAQILEEVATAIYGNQNRRQEIMLNLRLAELAGRRGEFFQARHFLWFCRRLLHREVDSTFELAALGVERKLALAERKNITEIEAKWQSLKEFSSTRDRNLRVRLALVGAEQENPEDKVHGILSLSQRADSLEKKLSPLLQAGFLSDAALVAKLPPGPNAVAVLPRSLGLLVQSPEGIRWREDGLSSLQHKLLKVLSSGKEVSKEALVQSAWGYAYSALRHDSMVYAALSALRKALGQAGNWLHPTENGYKMEAKIVWARESEDISPQVLAKEAPVSSEMASRFNHRQIEILEWLQAARFISVAECREKFGVSEITALRDIDGLRKDGLVVRLGKARATRYGLAKGES